MLSRVCQRLSRIAQPMLFHTIDFNSSISIVPPKKRVIQPHRALQQKPSLRQHCRRLSIDVADNVAVTKTDDYAIADDLAKWLTGVRCLQNYGGFDGDFLGSRTWSLIRSLAKHMGEVRHWSLCRQGWGLYLQDVLSQAMEEITFSKLTKLALHRISEWKGHTLQLKSTLRMNPTQKLLRTAPITALSISDYEETTQCTAFLLQWPAALEHFQFGSFYNNPWTMTYPLFQSWLLIHRETLKSIDIGYLSRYEDSNSYIFNATPFPNLEYLRLSSESWNDFGENEETWVRSLGKAGIARETSLETNEIKFRLDYWYGMEQDDYPWDRMDHIRDELLRPNGRDLIYQTPPISKDEWLGFRKKEREAQRSEDETEWYENETDTATDAETRLQTPPSYYGGGIREYLEPLDRNFPILNN
ncbi:hypothetical protein BCR34DRAFT_601742 [Clohesyomyces aquaticus]|uniref:F-box domain-containing protein n=1 Tax=Clohesyomyces aquaticus TaxID=1231657 RepID=A0A1Y1ZLA4_9PLEO|nr:hypothetical protein BCR34DRAFT_601742 [Clohesyomyces aquaticus]